MQMAGPPRPGVITRWKEWGMGLGPASFGDVMQCVIKAWLSVPPHVLEAESSARFTKGSDTFLEEKGIVSYGAWE